MKSKQYTIRDVAALTNVSAATVSMVLNGSEKISPQTRERVMKAVKTMNYHRNPHARSLSSSKSFTVGLSMTDITNPFFGMIASYLQSEIASRGYSLILGMSNNSTVLEKKLVEKFLDAGVDGIFIVPAHERNPNLAHIYELTRRNLPFVYLTTYYPSTSASYVMTDLAKGSYDMTRYLLESGNKYIVLLCGYRELVLSAYRIQGFLKAHSELNIHVLADQIIESAPDFKGGYIATRELIARRKPDAIMAINDVMCMGALSYLKETGIQVPQDISVAGYDDLIFSSMLETPLSTIRQPIEEMCRRAADILFSEIEVGVQEQESVLLEPILKIRKSTRT